jgi:TfoX/Sxy family transcriptional regulator of competence genes
MRDRIRALLEAKSPTREVPMFGGLSFMVNEKMVASVRSDGDLLVRVDPERSAELVTRDGARPAEMGAGRAMGAGWIDVAEEAIATDEQLSFWIEVALEYNEVSQ